jgi:hypothetical protein
LESGEPIELSDIDLTEGIPGDAPSGQANLITPGGEMEVSFDVVDGRAIVEGDIDLGPAETFPAADDGLTRASASLVYDRWPNGKIPYMPPTFNQTAINGAIATIEAATDIDFVINSNPGFNDSVLVFVQSKDANVSSSAVGRQGGWQMVRIWPTHGKSVVIHELLHAAGLWHEQSRADRDSSITVLLPCISMSRWHNFDKKVPLEGFDVGDFDFASIMLYGSFAFSTSSSCPSMVRKDGSTFGSNNTMSAGDIAAINLMF